MKLLGESKLLRIFVGSCDKVNNTPLYEFIVFSAKRSGLAGATVLKGMMGYGATSVIHTAKILDLSEDLPIVIEIIDEESKISSFITSIEKYLESSKYGGLITTENVNVIVYKPSKK